MTAGPTQEPLDPVRYIANRSSGKQGYAIAAALRNLGADLVFVTGPNRHCLLQSGVETVIQVATARQMMDGLRKSARRLPTKSTALSAVRRLLRIIARQIETDHKIKKERGGLTEYSAYAENPDILKVRLADEKGPPAISSSASRRKPTTFICPRRSQASHGRAATGSSPMTSPPGEHCAMGGDLQFAVTILDH